MYSYEFKWCTIIFISHLTNLIYLFCDFRMQGHDEMVLNVALIYPNLNLLKTWCETKIDYFVNIPGLLWDFINVIVKMIAFVILYQNVTFKNIFHLWNDILFSADLNKATQAQTHPPNQPLHMKIKCVVKPGCCSLICLGHFIILTICQGHSNCTWGSTERTFYHGFLKEL